MPIFSVILSIGSTGEGLFWTLPYGGNGFLLHNGASVAPTGANVTLSEFLIEISKPWAFDFTLASDVSVTAFKFSRFELRPLRPVSPELFVVAFDFVRFDDCAVFSKSSSETVLFVLASPLGCGCGDGYGDPLVLGLRMRIRFGPTLVAFWSRDPLAPPVLTDSATSGLGRSTPSRSVRGTKPAAEGVFGFRSRTGRSGFVDGGGMADVPLTFTSDVEGVAFFFAFGSFVEISTEMASVSTSFALALAFPFDTDDLGCASSFESGAEDGGIAFGSFSCCCLSLASRMARAFDSDIGWGIVSNREINRE